MPLERVKPTTAPAPAPILQRIGGIGLPAGIDRHRFYIEALANAHVAGGREDGESRVVGTQNTKLPEMYGWGANVDQHVDNTGFMYLLPLSATRSVLYAKHLGDFQEVVLQPGEVVRLWDFAPHWTEDAAPAVAMFVGSFAEPQDELAMQLLAKGVLALAAGDYYGAPRVQPGFRLLLEDECWAATAGMEDAEIMLTADARAQGRYVVDCAEPGCELPAVVMDSKWPYFSDGCLCRAHQVRGREPLTMSQADALVDGVVARLAA